LLAGELVGVEYLLNQALAVPDESILDKMAERLAEMSGCEDDEGFESDLNEFPLSKPQEPILPRATSAADDILPLNPQVTLEPDFSVPPCLEEEPLTPATDVSEFHVELVVDEAASGPADDDHGYDIIEQISEKLLRVSGTRFTRELERTLLDLISRIHDSDRVTFSDLQKRTRSHDVTVRSSNSLLRKVTTLHERGGIMLQTSGLPV